MINTLFVLNIIVVVLLIGIILLQKSEGGVLGMGGSGTKNGVFSTRTANTFITRLTYILAGLFFTICMLLAALVSHREKQKSFIETMAEKENKAKEVKTPNINKIPEGKVKRELLQETVKRQALKNKPKPPTN